jgi:hypothetical protein
MDTQTTTYDDDLLKVVNRFLHTVVVVDDRAFKEAAPQVILPDEDTDPAPGGRGVSDNLADPIDPDEHDLDAKKVTDAFARDGLICGLLEPTPGSGIDDELLMTARRADLVVIDWVLNRDNGAMALSLISKILISEAGTAERQRLRAIAIYTGQRELKEIAGRIQEVLTSVYPNDVLVRHDDGLALTKGPVRIAVFAKENAPELSADLADRRVLFTDLPSRLRKEFSLLTNGLITSVALAALAALRDDTHRILKVLNPSLDAAYLGHRSALPVPEDAERHAVALVASELRSVIEDHDIGRQVQEDVLLRWVADREKQGLKLGNLLVDANEKITGEQIVAMLSRGLGSDSELAVIQAMGSVTKSKWKTIKKHATQVFAHTVIEADDADSELASCMMLRTLYARPDRMLHLGTVIQCPSGEYLLCVQPVCDSVRLTADGRSFPFLKLALSDDDKKHLVIPGDGSVRWKSLLILKNPRDIVMEHFSPTHGQDAISAIRTDDSFVFKNSSGLSFGWICQLKYEFAQKVAVDLASEFAQVAVDPAEIMRLSQ